MARIRHPARKTGVSAQGASLAMLGPALRQLFLELDKFASSERTTFENDLHRELLQVAQMLGAAQRAVSPILSTIQIESFSLSGIRQSITEMLTPKTYVDLDLGSAPPPVPITLTTQCSYPKCPNKRIK
jgi:hypothetical protein